VSRRDDWLASWRQPTRSSPTYDEPDIPWRDVAGPYGRGRSRPAGCGPGRDGPPPEQRHDHLERERRMLGIVRGASCSRSSHRPLPPPAVRPDGALRCPP
jgi:hypothetical protein